MALKRIRDYDAAPSATGTEMIEAETASGDSIRLTAQQIANLADGGGGGGGGAAPSVEVTASLTLAEVHAGTFISANHASAAITITVPADSSVTFPVDTEIHVRQRGEAGVTIAAAGGVAVNQPASRTKKLSERYAVVTLKKVAPNDWALFGDLEVSS